MRELHRKDSAFTEWRFPFYLTELSFSFYLFFPAPFPSVSCAFMSYLCLTMHRRFLRCCGWLCRPSGCGICICRELVCLPVSQCVSPGGWDKTWSFYIVVFLPRTWCSEKCLMYSHMSPKTAPLTYLLLLLIYDGYFALLRINCKHISARKGSKGSISTL